MKKWLKRLGWVALAVFALVVLCGVLPPQAGLLVWGLYVLCFFKWRVWFKRLVWAGVGLLGLIVVFGLLVANQKPSSSGTEPSDRPAGESTNNPATRTPASEITAVLWDKTVVKECGSYPRFADPRAQQEALSFATLIGCKSLKVYDREKVEDLSRHQIQTEINAEERVDAEGVSSLKQRYPGIPDRCAATLQSLGLGINLCADHNLGCTKEHVPNILRLWKEKCPGGSPQSRKQSATLP